MKDLKEFSKYIKKKDTRKSNINKIVWEYTRVSTANQTDNYSLENQEDSIAKLASECGYIIDRIYGQSDESAASDDRKEFNRFLFDLRRAKVKPYAILVWTMSRFSRTGGGGVSLANEIVNKLGVHIIEVSSRIDTTTEDGKIQLFAKLIDARKETITKLTTTIPGMIKFVKSGKYLGVAPLGYDHFGRKVKDHKKWHYEQKIVLNDTGKKLKLAWGWKVQGYKDYEIKAKLKLLGVDIRLQKLSAMWRKPFYCGVQINSFVGEEAVMGTWEPMISIETYEKVGQILSGGRQGYQIKKNFPERPLIGTLLCSCCGKKLCGYEVKKKKKHYYKCQQCKGVSINASTSLKFKKKVGAHELFIDHLNEYQINPRYLGAFTRQLEKNIESTNKTSKVEEAKLRVQLKALEDRKQYLRRMVAMGELEPDMLEFIPEIESGIKSLNEKLLVPDINLSNLKNVVYKAVDFTQEASKYWASYSLKGKRDIQELVFPEGLMIDTKNRQYLTSKVNALFAAKAEFIRVVEGQKNKIPVKNDEDSCVVAGAGFEPTAFGL